MPGNTVVINNSKNLEWYVGDSKMPKLMRWLDKYGVSEVKKGKLAKFKKVR